MIHYIDIHSHEKEGHDEAVISHPTLSVVSDRIFDYKKPFWCGLHPCESMDVDEVLGRLERVKERLIGVGEIGLDALCGKSGQRELFEAQLDFARRNGLPVTVHVVKCYNDIVEIFRRKNGQCVVIHSFVSHPVVAQHLLDAGCYLSFGETSMRSNKSIDALRRMPLDRLFLETDTKGDIRELYRKVAEIKLVKEDFLKQKIYENYKCLIG